MVKKLFSVVLFLFLCQVIWANSTPVLSNFRIVDNHKNRVYFDSEGAITGTSTNGFIINGKTISGLSINLAGATLGSLNKTDLP